MFLHIGRDRIVRFDDIIGIFDIETATTSKITREYLKASSQKDIVTITQELPKSFIVCDGGSKYSKNKRHNFCRNNHEGLDLKISDKNNTKVYISQISSSTLKKRLEAANLSESPLDINVSNDK